MGRWVAEERPGDVHELFIDSTKIGRAPFRTSSPGQALPVVLRQRCGERAIGRDPIAHRCVFINIYAAGLANVCISLRPMQIMCTSHSSPVSLYRFFAIRWRIRHHALLHRQ